MMKRILTQAASLAAIALLVAGSAYAGGASCGAKETAARVASGGHCDGASNSAASMAKACNVKANQNIYSFAVPAAMCDHCVQSIQTALMAQKGISCAHVDLTRHTTYVIADRSVDKKAIAKTIATAGFKNNFRGQGAKVQAEFAKAMNTAGEKGASSCSRKEKDKV